MLLVGLLPKVSAEAATADDLTYTISGGAVTITGCNKEASGELVIPTEIEGYPVTAIRYDAFYCCSNLTSVEIPKGITSIGDNAFFDCSSLVEVIIPDGVTEIGHSAFRACTSLTSITIPKSVTTIHDYAFQGCTNLSEVTLSEGLLNIGYYAFSDCKALTNVTIPQSVTLIYQWAFDGSSNVVLHVNSDYVAEYVQKYNIAHVLGIKYIGIWGDSRWEFCLGESLQDIYFSVDYYGEIGSGRVPLDEVVVSGYDASKSGWQDITVEYEGVKGGCTVYVRESHDYQVGWMPGCYTCAVCRELAGVEKTEIKQMPDKTEYCIGEEVDVSGLIITAYLTDGTILDVSDGYHILESNTNTAGKNTVVIISDYEAFEARFDITVYGEHQYSDDSDMICDVCGYERTISSVEVATRPSKTEFCLGEGSDFSGLKLKVNFSDNSFIYVQEGFAINGFSSEHIGNCTITVQYEGKQTTFDINICAHSYDDVVDVECNKCPYIREVTSIEVMSLPSKTVYCFGETFDYSGLIIKLYYSDGTTGQISAGYEIDGIDSEEEGVSIIYLSYAGKYTSFEVSVVPHTYAEATDVECDKCEYIRSVIAVNLKGVNNRTTYCLDEVFDNEGCQLHIMYDDGSDGIVSDGFTITGFDSSSIKTCKIVLAYKGFNAEYDVTIVEHTYSSDTDDTCNACRKRYQEGKFVYRIKDNKVTIISCDTTVIGIVEVPATIGGRAVTKIAPYAFQNCISLTSVILPDSIVSIGEGAFKGCYAMREITIPEGITSIEKYTFASCSDLREVNLPKTLTSIGVFAFKECYSLKEIVIPTGVSSIGNSAFEVDTIKIYLNSAYAKYYAISNDIAYVIVPETLEIKTLPHKTKYSLNEGFCFDGLVLVASYYDDTSEDIVNGWEVIGFDSSQVGVYTITIKYGTKSITFDIEVHDYRTTWTTDGENHWHECAACGDKTDIETHVYDNTCDTTCNVCEHTRSDAHEYGNTWSTDETKHWHECILCGDKKSLGQHEYDNMCDTNCNVCGKERSVIHAYVKEWTTDEESHWHECSLCSDKNEFAQHAYDNACDTICNVCDYEREHVKPDKLEIIKMPTKSEYRLGEEYDLRGLVLKATYYDGTTETITDGYEIVGIDSEEPGTVMIFVEYHGQFVQLDVTVHEYKTEWSKDSEKHWHDCSLCDSKADMGTHTYGNWQVVTPATTTSEGLEKRVCTVCSHEETRAIAKLPSGTWKKDSIGWWYQNANGTYPANCWKEIDNVWYYFNASGYILTGWQSIGGTWYYFAGSGAMMTGWQSIGGTWYYFAGSGAMVTGWQSIGGTWYYFAGSGAMVTGWQSIGGTWYYFTSSGAMATGWQSIGGTWYYFAGSGAMVTGWQSIGGVWYYFEGSGAMVANRWVGNYYLLEDGSMATNQWIGSYYVGADGVWVP